MKIVISLPTKLLLFIFKLIYAFEPQEYSYACDECDYVAPRRLHLERHKAGKHSSFPCDQCSFVTTSKALLNRHFKLNHKTEEVACDQCDYVAKKKKYMRDHVESKHMGKY